MHPRIALLFLSLSLCTAPAIAETVMEVIPLNNRPASEMQPIIAPLLDSSDSLVGNGFRLIVKTTPAKLEKIKALIKQLDTALNNLSISVVQSRDISAEQLNAEAGIQINVPIHRPSDSEGQINARLSDRKRHKKSRNEQLLRTLEGNPAYIRIGSSHPIQNIYIYDAYGRRTVTRSTHMIDATTGFSVLPRLNGDQVILEISPWSDNMQRGGVIDTRQASTVIRTKLGEWVEIGAADEARQSESSGILSHRESSSTGSLRILVKVEKVN